ncbi:MAG: sulfatase [Pirellulales bacterium]
MSRLPLSLVLAFVAVSASRGLLAADTRPNIIFILADDLGYTDLGCYGSTYYQTPNIDRLAASGLRFTNGYTCGPNCQPTRAALMSGQYGPRTGVYTVGSIDRFPWQTRPLRPVDNAERLPLDKITVAQALHSAGYATGMFGKWHLGSDREHHPSRRGFEEAIVSQGRHYNFKTDPATDHPQEAYLADFLTERAVDFIRRHKDGPFFLYLPHFAVHGPLEAKAELIEKFRERPAAGGHDNPVYAAMLASLDESVGRVLATLDELALAENTVVIFSSDNGGVGGYEREGIQGNSHTDNAPLKGGKGMLADGGIHVPYIYRWPDKIAPGGTCQTPIISVDLYPTLLELAGAAAPAGYTLDGESYAPLLTSPQNGRLQRDAIFWHFPGYLGAGGGTWRTLPGGAIRAGDWKLIEYFEDGRTELYNLRDDVSERKNLAAEQPDKVSELRGRLAVWRETVAAPMPQKNPDQKPLGENRRTRGRRARAAADD